MSWIDLWNLVAGAWIPAVLALVCVVGGVWTWIRIGHGAGAALLILGAIIGARAAGYLEARSDCNDSKLRDQVAQLKADKAALETRMAIAAAVARGAAEVAEGARKEASQWKGKADALESELSQKPAPPACNWTRDERRRLLEIPVGGSRGGRPDPRAR